MKNLIIALFVVLSITAVSCKKENFDKEVVVYHPDQFKSFTWTLKEAYEDKFNGNSKTWVVKNTANQVVVLRTVSEEIYWTKKVGDPINNTMVVALMTK